MLRECATEALMKDLSDLSIFNGIIKFYDCNETDVITPRTEICALDIESSRHKVMKKYSPH